MILITGASRGIGKYLFEKFYKSGEKVYGTYNRTIPVKSRDSHLHKVNICDPKSVNEWIETVKTQLKEITLINCAGINYTSYAHKANLEQWSQVIDVNVIGTFTVIKELLPIMRNQEYGRIINLSSVVAQTLVPGTSAYAASKAALWGMTRSIATENSKKGITINNLNLGYYNLGMISEVPKQYKKVLQASIPSGNLGDPKSIYNAIRFLIDNDYLNGTSIDMNSGLF